MIVGLTGGIGSGKSLVATMLAQRGAVIIDTDEIARQVVAAPSETLDRIREAFGSSVLRPSGDLDRAALAEIVFGDDAKRQRLNEITHPEILKRVLAQLGRYPRTTVVVVVVPLLFESGFERNCDKVLAVVAPPALRLQRVLARDGVDEAGVRARMSAQLPEGEYERRADIIIHNTGDTAALEREVDAAWERLLQASHA